MKTNNCCWMLLALLAVKLMCNDAPNQGNSLPKPTGEYLTAITYLSFTDESRMELFNNSNKSKRDITVKAWYPTDEKSGPEPYLPNVEFAIKYCQFTESFRDLLTNSGRDLPVSRRGKKYPVLVFSHGWGEHYSQNSILMEELASHGYIVFSIAHHYECKYSVYPDGRTVHIDFNSLRFQKLWREQQNPKAWEMLQKEVEAKNDDERMQVFVEISSLMPTGLKESPRYWAEDISFFLGRLPGIDKGHALFKGRLDLERIGVFGMSMGGIATGEVCLTDERVKAGISMDGGLHGSLLEGKLRTPFLFLNSKRFLGYGDLFTGRSIADCYSLSVKNSDHYNLSDYSVYPVQMVRSLLGTIDGRRMMQIMNGVVLAFFDQYLKHRRGADLVKEARKFPEIEMVTNIRRRID